MRKLIILVLLAVSPLLAKDIPQNSTDQSITVIILDADGDPNTSVTVTDLDLYIQRDGPGAQSAKVDLTALASADAAHTDYGAFHKGNGGVRVDIPDANLTDPVKTLINYYVVDGATSNKMAVYEVQISDPLELSDVNDYVNGHVDTVISAVADANTYVNVRTTTILADTDELQTDWADGGRLDLILDSVATFVSSVSTGVGRYSSIYGPSTLSFLPAICLLLYYRKAKRNEKEIR